MIRVREAPNLDAGHSELMAEKVKSWIDEIVLYEDS
jgi:hypothetical protein